MLILNHQMTKKLKLMAKGKFTSITSNDSYMIHLIIILKNAILYNYPTKKKSFAHEPFWRTRIPNMKISSHSTAKFSNKEKKVNAKGRPCAESEQQA